MSDRKNVATAFFHKTDITVFSCNLELRGLSFSSEGGRVSNILGVINFLKVK